MFPPEFLNFVIVHDVFRINGGDRLFKYFLMRSNRPMEILGWTLLGKLLIAVVEVQAQEFMELGPDSFVSTLHGMLLLWNIDLLISAI
jgi:hypothetical protein